MSRVFSLFKFLYFILFFYGVATILNSSSQHYLNFLRILLGRIFVSSVPRATVYSLKT